MSTETCKLYHKDCTPWVHINGHICQDCCAMHEWLNGNYGWISVKDRVPEEDGRYLVCTSHWSNWVGVSSLRDSKWDDSKVSYWMPLPSPPESINET